MEIVKTFLTIYKEILSNIPLLYRDRVLTEHTD